MFALVILIPPIPSRSKKQYGIDKKLSAHRKDKQKSFSINNTEKNIQIILFNVPSPLSDNYLSA